MGIYFVLGSTLRLPPHSRAREKMIIAERIVKYYESSGMFELKSLNVWDKARSESLGGNLIESIESLRYKSIKEEFIHNIVENYYRRFYNSIIVFEGKWNIDGTIVDGFISVNNDFNWRSVYYDIEIDCYSEGGIDDISEIFLGLNYFSDMFKHFLEYLENYAGESRLLITSIFYSYGVPHEEDLENILVMHTNSMKNFVSFLYKRLKADNDSWVKDHVKPYTRPTYLNEIFEHELTEKKINQYYLESDLMVVPGGSITYIAGREDSFFSFYQKFKSGIFQPIANSLPSSSDLKAMIKRALNEARKMDDYM